MTDSILQILERVHAEAKSGDEMAVTTAKQISRGSPLAQATIVEQMIRGSKMSLEKVLEMEFYLCNAMRRPHRADFCEGIRALLIDKDNNPQWKHKSIHEVTKEEVDALFKIREGPPFGVGRSIPKL